MRATAAEEMATAALRENCKRRHLVFKVAQRPNGGWRGVVFGLEAEANALLRNRPTRLELVEHLNLIVLERWPLKRGRPPEQRAAA